MTLLNTSRISIAILAAALCASAQNVRVNGATPQAVSNGSATRVKRMDPTQMLRLSMVLQPRNQAAFQQFLRDVQDRKSPKFHRFLTFEQWKSAYAPLDSDVAKVAAWAGRSGFTVVHQFRNNLAVKVEGNVQAIEQAFTVQLNQYSAGSRTFFSNDRDPAIPPDLTGMLKDIQGLNDYFEIHSVSQRPSVVSANQPIYKPGPFLVRETAKRAGAGHPLNDPAGSVEAPAGTLKPHYSGAFAGSLEAIDLYSSEAYDLNALRRFSQCCNPNHNPLASPKETSIAIIGTNTMALTDLQAFTAQYGMAFNLTQVQINSPSCCDSEITLDVESAVAMANSFGAEQDTAQVFAYEGGGTHLSDLLDAWQEAQSEDAARNASTSFGQYESGFGGIGTPSISDFTDVINAMAAEGWSIAAASGDHGSTQDCNNLSVDFPASSPSVIAIGGTTLALSESGGQLLYGGESPWTGPGCGTNDQSKAQNLGGGGGGCSGSEPAPFWQGASAGCGNMRALPDIALNSGNPQVFYYGGGWTTFGGTSVASPEFAGFLAHINSYLLTLGNICSNTHDQPCAGFGDPAAAIWFVGGTNSLYPGARDPFYDITSGCNGGDGQTGYCAGPHYDLATGWGSVNLLQLAWIINNYLLAPGAHTAQVNFTGPAVNSWSNTDQHVNFSIGIAPFTGTGASVGVAGYGGQWDAVVPDILTHATPGSGDSFYDGPPKLGSSDYLSLAAVGQGCHTAHVRAWDNIGQETFDETYGPVCLDTAPPVVNCTPPPVAWTASDVAVPCTASDALSGLANPLDASFFLRTHVAFGTETASAFTPIYAVLDVAGNSSPLQYGPFEVDKRAPSITITTPTATAYTIHQVVDASYSCSDGGSGLATCAGTAPSGGPIDTASVAAKNFTVNATDNVANAGTQSVAYSVTYNITPLFNPNQPTLGILEDIRLQISDAKGVNLSSNKITVTATAVDGDPTKAVPLGFLDPGNKFFFVPGFPALTFYDYLLDVHKLAAGTHTLSFIVQGDPVAHSVSFNLKK